MNGFAVRALLVHEDQRGHLIELVKDARAHAPRGRQVFLTTAHPGFVKGNHVHRRKTEWFIVLSGRMRMRLRSGSESEDLIVDAAHPTVVEVFPGTAHALRNEGAEELLVLVYADEMFDQSDPDTYPEHVL